MTLMDLWTEYFIGPFYLGNAKTKAVDSNLAIIKANFIKISETIILENSSQFLLTDSTFTECLCDCIRSASKGIVFLRNCFASINIKEYIVYHENIYKGALFVNIHQTSFTSSSGWNGEYSGAVRIISYRAQINNCNTSKVFSGGVIFKTDDIRIGSFHRFNLFDGNNASISGVASIEEGGGILFECILTNNICRLACFYMIGNISITVQRCIFNKNKAQSLFFVSAGLKGNVVESYISDNSISSSGSGPIYINNMSSVPQIMTQFAYENDCNVKLINKEIFCRSMRRIRMERCSIFLFSCLR